MRAREPAGGEAAISSPCQPKTMRVGDRRRASNWPNASSHWGVDVIDCSSGGILGRPPAGALKPAYGYLGPLCGPDQKAGRHMTMAVGLIVHAEQAEQILQQGPGRPCGPCPGDALQPELGDGRGAKARTGPGVRAGAAALPILAGAARGHRTGFRAFDLRDTANMKPTNVWGHAQFLARTAEHVIACAEN